jgi:hypothetical protein
MWCTRIKGQFKHVQSFPHWRSFSQSPATWMGDSLQKIGDLSLKDLTLPGTHDSGSFFLTDIPLPGETSPLRETLFKLANLVSSSVGKIAINWGQAQNQGFLSQLNDGIRYFDLRVGWDEKRKTWVTHHFVQGSLIQDLLQSIKQFIDRNTKEIVIVEMSHFNVEDVRTLRTMVRDILRQIYTR